MKHYNTWKDVYSEFLKISDSVYTSTKDVDEAEELVQGHIDHLYAQHEGDPLWDEAYERWYE